MPVLHDGHGRHHAAIIFLLTLFLFMRSTTSFNRVNSAILNRSKFVVAKVSWSIRDYRYNTRSLQFPLPAALPSPFPVPLRDRLQAPEEGTISHGRDNLQVTEAIKLKETTKMSHDDPTAAAMQQERALELYHQMRNCSDPLLAGKLSKALNVLEDALRLFGHDRLISSFNGGKDAVVIMHLLRAVVAKYTQDRSDGNFYQPKLMYFTVKDEFPEVLEYIKECEQQYGFSLIKYESGIVKGIEEYIRGLGTDTPTVAFVLGTRVGDPNSGDQEIFTPASTWMPVPFMRVNPILHWQYGDVWHFLRYLQLPYCTLYDRGYTSLGKTTDTFPNPALQKKGNTASDGEYWPAWMLEDWSLERAGRGKSAAAVTGKILVESSFSSTSSGQEGDQAKKMAAKTAGMIVIGDEILNGSVQDVNMQLTANMLKRIGIALLKVAIVSDSVSEIAHEIRAFSQKFDLVITSGGIGPTHDDVTIKAVAQAFNTPLSVNPIMLEHLEKIERLRSSSADVDLDVETRAKDIQDHHNRLSTMPENAVLRFPPSGDNISSSDANVLPRKPLWPILQCENCFVLPGVPQYFQQKMETIVNHFIESNRLPTERKLLLSIEERDIVAALNSVVAAYPQVKIGSYPHIDNPQYKTVITMSCEESSPSGKDLLDEVCRQFLERLPQDALASDITA